ncbi:465_t:CDS:1 [Racocetra fulgida]|uniref:465_t:CDS:1 n=1 Tax=Racocetra fulgida TaxID=60492 RepID=A0A9N9FQ11_9GLOM|nr:465_t:CDS:1 [Racocetra fulgida]
MTIGFGFDVLKITSGRTSLTQSTGGEKRSALNEYWYNRRKGYQEMVDKLYVKYMERLHDVQQQQYWQWQQQQTYYYPQGNISEYDENAIAANYGPYDMNTTQIQ